MTPATTEAAILVELHKPLEVDTIELPESLGFGQVLVEFAYSGICGSQIGEIDGVKGPDEWLPHLLGHEGSGEILAVGEGVKTVAPGDHVVVHWRPGDGLESDTPSYRRNSETVNAGRVTTFNRHAVVSENRVTAIPKDFDLRTAPLFGCAITTGLGIVTHDAKLQLGESIVVFGAGGIGLNVIQGAAMISAHPVVAVDVVDSKLDAALEFGATDAIDGSNSKKAQSAIREIVGEDGADVVVETTGITSVIESAYTLTQPQGRTILVGVPRAGENVSIHTLPLHFGKVLTGSHGGDAQPHIEIPRYIDLLKAGKLKTEGLITDEFPLQDINRALEVVRSGTAGRVLIDLKAS